MSKSKDAIRASILATVEPKKEIVSFRGVEIELRQPNLEDFMNRDEAKPNTFVAFLISNAYIPNTDDKVFDDADYDVLVKMPMTKDVVGLVEKVNTLMDIKVEEKVKN